MTLCSGCFESEPLVDHRKPHRASVMQLFDTFYFKLRTRENLKAQCCQYALRYRLHLLCVHVFERSGKISHFTIVHIACNIPWFLKKNYVDNLSRVVVLEIPKMVLWQTVKTQIKCSIMAKTLKRSAVKMHYFKGCIFSAYIYLKGRVRSHISQKFIFACSIQWFSKKICR